MTLEITKEFRKENDLETVVISAHMLLEVSTHLFISSHSWDKIIVEICEDIPDDVLQYIRLQSDNISVRLPENITDKELRMLVALFPDKGGSIRRAFMAGRDLSQVVNICTE